MQTGYRLRDGSSYGYGTSSAGPTRKIVAVCRSNDGASRWLTRLAKWAAEGAELSGRAGLIPIYELTTATGAADVAGIEPALCVGPSYYQDHGAVASLQAIVLGIRESHSALRWEARRRTAARAQIDRKRSDERPLPGEVKSPPTSLGKR
jgi:hypothetical protein